jgi:hypothetical protein
MSIFYLPKLRYALKTSSSLSNYSPSPNYTSHRAKTIVMKKQRLGDHTPCRPQQAVLVQARMTAAPRRKPNLLPQHAGQGTCPTSTGPIAPISSL